MLLSSGVDFKLENDFQWQNCRNIVIRSLENKDFNAYRDVRLLMADYLNRKGKLKDSLITYLEVAYLDMNLTTLDPRMIITITEMAKELQVDKEEVKKAFILHNTGYGRVLGLTLSAEKCWGKLNKLIGIV